MTHPVPDIGQTVEENIFLRNYFAPTEDMGFPFKTDQDDNSEDDNSDLGDDLEDENVTINQDNHKGDTENDMLTIEGVQAKAALVEEGDRSVTGDEMSDLAKGRTADKIGDGKEGEGDNDDPDVICLGDDSIEFPYNLPEFADNSPSALEEEDLGLLSQDMLGLSLGQTTKVSGYHIGAKVAEETRGETLKKI